ncbi:hypothetical protein [Anaerorhabdus sp.]|uniref:hypothetical protein n=1 Tax=Anaerorhabdus sp. TaxID=1872524 RepID=UPI002FC8BF2D
MAKNKTHIAETGINEETNEVEVNEEIPTVADVETAEETVETTDKPVVKKEETPAVKVDETPVVADGKPKEYEVKSPNESFRGVCASVSFLNGVGYTSNEHLVEWFKKHGFEVTEKK